MVGLIATDGCLCPDGRHIDITSKDFRFLQAIKDTIGLGNKISIKYNGRKQEYSHIQISNKNFYEFLLSVGLTQNKSLTLSEVDVPNQFFIDFLRGVIDGDGCIRHWIHPSNKCEQWSLRIYSGSEKFISWLNNTIKQLLKVFGRVHKNASNIWVLKYGKMAARGIARQCYYEGCLGLDRKIQLAGDCISSYKGWNRSQTILN